MECSPDDALNLLNSWREQETVLNLWLASPTGWAFRAVAIGTVEVILPDAIHVAFVSEGGIMVDITKATYKYSDAREALPELKNVIDKDIVCTLLITTPECRFALGEMRREL